MARGTWGGTLDPSIFQVTFRFLRGTSHCQTGFKLRDVATNDNTAQEVADQVNTTLNAAFRGLLSGLDSLESIDVLKLGTEEGGTHLITAGSGGGSLTSTAASQVPSFMCANIAMKSEIRKRYGQGRMFLPIANDSEFDGNTLHADGVSVLQSFLTPLQSNFMGDPLTHDLILVNAHPLLPVRGAVGAPGYRPEIPASWYDVVTNRINSTVTALRSRRVGVGS
jgi:hypothetical protein